MDVSPKQLVSVAAALILFLENDDANRALMGSNMQRQAVPLIRAEAPLVGTGMEAVVARDSGAAIAASGSGRGRPGRRDAYRRARHGAKTMPLDVGRGHLQPAQVPALEPEHLHHPAPAREEGRQGRQVGDMIADGPSTHLGELALGRNVLVAFMPWNGYNFEDSILISERIVAEDVLHLDPHRGTGGDGPRYQAGAGGNHARHPERSPSSSSSTSTKRASSTSAPKYSRATSLVGKVTPKGETTLTPEESCCAPSSARRLPT